MRSGSCRTHRSERPWWRLCQCGLWGRCGSMACRGVGPIGSRGPASAGRCVGPIGSRRPTSACRCVGPIGSRRPTSASRCVGPVRIWILWVVILLCARRASLVTRSPVSSSITVGFPGCTPWRPVGIVVSRRIVTVEIIVVIGRVHFSRSIIRRWSVTLI